MRPGVVWRTLAAVLTAAQLIGAANLNGQFTLKHLPSLSVTDQTTQIDGHGVLKQTYYH